VAEASALFEGRENIPPPGGLALFALSLATRNLPNYIASIVVGESLAGLAGLDWKIDRNVR
jgi:hypothetical protein